MARYRFVLVEEPETLPVLYTPPEPGPEPAAVLHHAEPMELLLEALWQLSFRGVGAEAWAPALADNPLAFLLDAIGDGVILRRGSGAVVYANPAAQRIGLPPWQIYQGLTTLERGRCRYERRCMAFQQGNESLLLEVLRRLEE